MQVNMILSHLNGEAPSQTGGIALWLHKVGKTSMEAGAAIAAMAQAGKFWLPEQVSGPQLFGPLAASVLSCKKRRRRWHGEQGVGRADLRPQSPCPRSLLGVSLTLCGLHCVFSWLGWSAVRPM